MELENDFINKLIISSSHVLNKFLIDVKNYLSLIRLGEVNLTPCLHISRRTNRRSAQFYTIVKQPIWSSLKVKKCWHHLLYAGNISLFATKKYEKLIKIVNINEENLHIFWTTWGISMKFSAKMCLTITLRLQKTRALPSL